MKMGLWVWVFILAFMTVCAESIEVVEKVVNEKDTGLRIPFVERGDVAWQGSAPLWLGESLGISAELRGASTREHLLFQVIVHDEVHENEFHGKNLWRGDSLYLSLDARGDTPPDRAKDDPYDPDDAVFVFGLGSKGAEFRDVKSGRPPGQAPAERVRSIVRDEATKTTVYDIAIPWSELSSAYGQSSAFGLALCVAHKNRAGKDLNWGRITAGKTEPRQLNRVALQIADSEFVTIAPRRIRLVEEPTAEVIVAVQSTSDAKITIQFGDETAVVDSPAGRVMRYAVRISSGRVSMRAHQVKVKVVADSLEENALFEITTPALGIEQFRVRMTRLKNATDHPLLKQHLTSTLAVVLAAADRLPLERSEHPERIRELMNAIEVISSKLPNEKLEWSEFQNRGLPLIFAFVSEKDRTLQFYALQFPYHWNPERAYPLTVYLHGAGPYNPVDNLVMSFDNSHQDTLFTDDLIDPENVPPSHRGFVLAPWARGNSSYRYAGEDDVWQSIALVLERFEVDRDRLYMSGFSMGCHGAWALAARTPDLWAGINLASGFYAYSDTRLEFFDENVRGIPLVNWVGAMDQRMLDGAIPFQKRMEEKGMDSQLEVTPRLPHTYPYENFQTNIGKLMQLSRPELKEFSFVADTAKHIGRNGVRLKVDTPIDIHALPQFSCRIEGNTVTIDSKNSDGLEITPLELGLSGSITIHWNGEKVYEGSDETIALGEPLIPVRYRWARPF